MTHDAITDRLADAIEKLSATAAWIEDEPEVAAEISSVIRDLRELRTALDIAAWRGVSS